MPLIDGTILNNRYQILHLLGQGGYGAVYLAQDLSMGEKCAVKENLELTPASRDSFLREARMLYKLRHTHLPAVHDQFIIPGQGQYLVMDYIEGDDLQTLLDKNQAPLPVEPVITWLGQVLDALIYLHSQKPPVIHRDIKPANIRITPGGQAVLVDFGIAKEYNPVQATSTHSRALTPGYAPPEQFGHGQTDAQSDLYSLGATFYALLTGIVPPSAGDVMAEIAEPPRPVHELNPTVPAEISAMISRAMQFRRSQRTPSATVMKSDLHRVTAQAGSAQPIVAAASEGISSQPVSLPASNATASETLPRLATAQTPTTGDSIPSSPAQIPATLPTITQTPGNTLPPVDQAANEPVTPSRQAESTGELEIQEGSGGSVNPIGQETPLQEDASGVAKSQKGSYMKWVRPLLAVIAILAGIALVSFLITGSPIPGLDLRGSTATVVPEQTSGSPILTAGGVITTTLTAQSLATLQQSTALSRPTQVTPATWTPASSPSPTQRPTNTLTATPSRTSTATPTNTPTKIPTDTPVPSSNYININYIFFIPAYDIKYNDECRIYIDDPYQYRYIYPVFIPPGIYTYNYSFGSDIPPGEYILQAYINDTPTNSLRITYEAWNNGNPGVRVNQNCRLSYP